MVQLLDSKDQSLSSRTHRRRLRIAPWKAAATSVTAAAFMCTIASAAFLTTGTRPHSHCALFRPSLLPRNVLANTVSLTRFSNSNSSNNSSRSNQMERLLQIETVPDGMEERKAKIVSIKPKRKIVTMKKNPSIAGIHRITSPNRMSTMPGLSSTSTTRQKAYRDGIRIVEENTGKRFVDSPEKRLVRRQANGENLYKQSTAVPDSMMQFAKEIHKEERITRKQEIELGEKTQEAIRLQNLYELLETKLQREPTDDEWCAAAGKINMEAIRQAIEEGVEAKNKLVTSNLRMVQSVVNTYIRNGLSAQYNAGDLMQEGIIALIRAAEKFEPDRGWKFSTYAMYWVRASVKRSQIHQSRVINLPPRLHENYKRLTRVEQEMMAASGRKPTRKEIGDAVGMSEMQVDRCIAAMEQRIHSLDQEIQNMKKPMSGNESANTLIDIIDAKASDECNLELNRVLLREDLIETLRRHLSAEEVELLLLRYGFKEAPSQDGRDVAPTNRQTTIAELSRIMGLKPDKVRRMINRALQQLKKVDMDELLAYEREL